MHIQASVGICIESNRVSLACLKSSFRGPRLAAHAEYPLLQESPEERTAEIRNHVNEFLNRNRIASADIYLGIQRDLAIVRYVELPLAVKENLRGTLSYEMEKYIPLPAGDIHFDCQIVEEDREANRLKALLIGVKRTSVDPYADPEHPLGAGISGLEIHTTALVNFFSCKSVPPGPETYAIACLGNGHAELCLVKQRLLHYSRPIPMGDPEAARRLMVEGLDQIRKSLGSEPDPLDVVLCGPEAGGVAERIRERKEEDLRLMEGMGPQISPEVSEAAYGLALRGMRKMPMEINLLPADLRKKISKFGYYTLFVLIGLLVLSVFAWGGSHLWHQKRISDRLTGEIQKLSAEVADIQKMQTRAQELEKRIAAINALRGRHVPALSIMLELTKAMPDGSWLDRLTVTDKGGEMEGYAASAPALIPLLAASPLLQDVAFLSPITKNKDGKEKFRIGFKVRQSVAGS